MKTKCFLILSANVTPENSSSPTGRTCSRLTPFLIHFIIWFSPKKKKLFCIRIKLCGALLPIDLSATAANYGNSADTKALKGCPPITRPPSGRLGRSSDQMNGFLGARVSFCSAFPLIAILVDCSYFGWLVFMLRQGQLWMKSSTMIH